MQPAAAPSGGHEPAGEIANVRVGLFVTCLVDAVRPEIGFSTLKLLEGAGLRGGGAGDADVLRPAGLQLGRLAHRAGTGGKGAARIRGVRLRRRCRAGRAAGRSRCSTSNCSGTIRTCKARVERLAGKTYELTDFLVNVAKIDELPVHLRRSHHLSRFLQRPARTRRQAAAARAAGETARRAADRDEGLPAVLRLRRHVLREVRRHLRRDRRREVPQHPGERCGRRRARRPRLHPEHRGAAAPHRRREDARAAHRAGLAGDA